MPPRLRQDPFELSSLLPAGVLALTLSALDQNPSQAIFREVWAAFDQGRARNLRPFCSPQDVALLEGLSYLIEHEFARFTSNFLSPHSLLVLRVYLIPYDLPGVQGRLMNRKEHTLTHYRRSLKGMLPRIISDNDYWRGADVLPPNPHLFLLPSLVGAFVDPSKFFVVSEFTTGPKNHGGDI